MKLIHKLNAKTFTYAGKYHCRLLNIKGAYWIIQRFLVHYQILRLSNIAITSNILTFLFAISFKSEYERQLLLSQYWINEEFELIQ